MAMATTFVLTMATGVGWIIEHAVLVPLGLEYLQCLLSFIMVIASLVQLTELFIAKQSPELHRTRSFLPLITTNCAVLGVSLLTIQENLNFIQALVYGPSPALGFSLVIILLPVYVNVWRNRCYLISSTAP